MTEYLDIVKENDNYRVRLEHDDSGEKPYDEGAVPILSREFGRYGRRWEAVNDAAEDFTGLLNALEERFDEQDIERFLKIFLDAYSVRWESSENNRYLAFDTAAWREKVGLSDEWLDAHTEARDKLAEGSLSEIISWANGEVYGWIVERKLATYTTYKDPTTGETVRETESEDWEQVESCWGYYGDEYAREAATEEFDRITIE
jgi:hypothetical protein